MGDLSWQTMFTLLSFGAAVVCIVFLRMRAQRDAPFKDKLKVLLRTLAACSLLGLILTIKFLNQPKMEADPPEDGDRQDTHQQHVEVEGRPTSRPGGGGE